MSLTLTNDGAAKEFWAMRGQLPLSCTLWQLRVAPTLGNERAQPTLGLGDNGLLTRGRCEGDRSAPTPGFGAEPALGFWCSGQREHLVSSL
ncbi:MAG: hypothetical protein JWM16_3381 [Verrucomicrobiales bacterium]|nr:hypothetical protein [Verrucomicrobiales bacterium]